MGNGNGLRAQRSAARRDAILAAALDEFAAQGFAATRLDDVARRAGVAKGTIYLHFRDKEALFQELVRSVLGTFVGTLEVALKADLPVRVVAEHVIEMFVREVYETRRKDVIRLILTEGQRFPQLAEFYYHEVLGRAIAAFRQLLHGAVARGELPNDALARFPQLLAAPAIVAILWNGLFDRFEPIDVRPFLRAHLDILFGAGRAA
jgi:AcrR family transcriptional regulator